MNVDTSLATCVSWLFEADPLAEKVVEQRARQLCLDTLGCMIAGLAKPEPRAMVTAMAGMDAGMVTLPGAAEPLSIGSAAYIAGLSACWDEACEGLPRAHGRPGLHAFAATFALGLGGHHSLGETLAALVTGFEVGGRMGEYLRIRPGMHVDGIWGTFGATAGAARLLGYSTATTIAALQGTACQLPYSLYLPITHGATVRNAYVGEAARRGIFQAMAANAGITTPPKGAIDAFDQTALAYDGPAKTLAPVGEWLITQGYLKPYAAVRHVHYGAQAAIEWRKQQAAVDTSKIALLELSIYGEAMTYCGNRAPTTPIQAQFSLSYGLAWALTAGDLGPDAYHAASLTDGEVRRLEDMVQITEAPEYTAQNLRAARLTVTSSDGTSTLLVDAVPGEVDMPLPADEVEAKFIRYVTPILGEDQANKMAQGILNAPLSSPLVDLLDS